MAFITAAIIAGGIGLAGTVGGSIIQANAAGSAADKQSAAAREANALQERMFEEQRADQQPWRQAGAQALSQMADPSFQKSFSQADFQQDPGYQFRMDEGQKALERSAAARGGLQSGGTLKALTQYGQNFASNEYGNAYNRFTNDQSNRFNRLSSLAGLGQTANSQIGQAGQNYAGNVGNNMTGLANAQGAAGIAGANALAGGISGVANNFGNNWMNMSMMNRFMPQNGSGLPSSPSTMSYASPTSTMTGKVTGISY